MSFPKPPHLSGRSQADFIPTEWKTFVESLYIPPPVTEKAKPYSYRVTPKGTQVLTVRGRSPKWLTRAELDDLSAEHKLDPAALFILAKTKVHIVFSSEEGLAYETANKELGEVWPTGTSNKKTTSGSGAAIKSAEGKPARRSPRSKKKPTPETSCEPHSS